MRRTCIAAYQGRRFWPSWIIRWRTWSRYSHVAWLDLDGSVRDAWAEGGVRHVADLSAGHDPGTVVDLYSVELTDVQAQGIVDFLVSQEGRGYDWWGAFGFFLRRVVQDPDKWFCSELLAEAFVRGAGIALLGCPSWWISPGELVVSPLLRFERSEVTR